MPMPLWVVLTFFGTLAVLALFFAGDRVHLRPWQRALLFAPAPVIWLLILTYHYLIWNPPRYPVIEGGQGRYLIPLAPLVLAAVAGPRWRWRADPAAIRVPLGVVLATVLVVALVTSARRFYF
ncbi:MAG: DUF2142 domain-containing protein [Archangiaceae bacterium]|nr:DUF2142 domain-containing protein [Archangiaceae bacterium]